MALIQLNSFLMKFHCLNLFKSRGHKLAIDPTKRSLHDINHSQKLPRPPVDAAVEFVEPTDQGSIIWSIKKSFRNSEK